MKAFEQAEAKWKPDQIAVEIKAAIRLSGNAFYEKWVDLLPLN